jgi:ParB family chromosome partitioning protein
MSNQTTIALNLLVPSKANVRVTGRKDGIAELAASIAAHGLRQNLNVRPTEDGLFEVVAGGRRLRALKLLVKQKQMAKDAPIDCKVLVEGEDATEISLVENTLRSAMHPDDQCNAFRTLIEANGLSVEDVAARFGVVPTLVRRRLKLAHVSPRLRNLFRKGDISHEQMMAFTLSDDHAAQEAVWKTLPEWNRDPEDIRDALTGEAVPLTDKLARFIGEDSYVAAGGAVLRDLFDDEGAGYLSDRALVLRLAEAKLSDAARDVQAEGWKWVATETTRDYSTHYGRVYPQPVEGEDALAYCAEDLARAGARLTIERDGTLQVERGLVHPDDREAEGRGEQQGRGVSKSKADPAGLSATLVEELTAHRTAALRVELARNPAVALAATVHAITLAAVYGGGAGGSCLALRADSETLGNHLQAPEDCPAHQAMADEGEGWGDRLPGDPADLWSWCLAQPQDVLLDLLAFATALSVNAVQTKHDRRNSDRLTHADQLADALNLDMGQWWTPSVAGFYARLPKAALAHVVRDAGKRGAKDIPGMKKDAAARHVADVLTGSGWLPEPLRQPAAAPALAEAA